VWTVFAVVNIGIGPLIWAAAVSALFDKTRGMALAIVFSGGGLAFLIFPPLAVMVEARFSWRAVYVVIAAIFLAGLLPLIVAWFRGAEDVAQTKPAGEPALPLLGLTLSEALRARQFWQLAAIALLIAIVEGAMMMHLYPILREQGLAPTMAAAIASMMGLALVVGRLVTGALLDRLAAPQVFAGSILLILLSCLTAQFSAGGTFLAATMSILLGLGAGGTTNSIAYLAGRYFGLRAYASIFGLLMGIFATGYGIAPAIAGHVRDLVGSYGPLFLSLAAAATLAMLLAAALGTAPEPRVTA
jgi:predicted MFS family arabinose efflux permease